MDPKEPLRLFTMDLLQMFHVDLTVKHTITSIGIPGISPWKWFQANMVIFLRYLSASEH